MESWLFLSIIGYSIGAISSVLDKYMMNLQYNPVTTSLLRVFFNASILASAGFLFLQLQLSPSILLYALIPGSLLALSFVVYLMVLRRKNASEVLPFWQSLDLMLIFLGSVIFFQEPVTLVNYGGIVVMLIGIYLVLTDNIRKTPRLNYSFLIVASILPIDLAYSLLIKKFLGAVPPISLAVSTYAIAFLMLSAVVLVMRLRSHTHQNHAYVKPQARTVFTASLFAAAGVGLLYIALSQGYASKVYPMAGISSIMVFLLATAFLKEKFYYHRLVGTLIVFLGMYFISL